MYVLGGEHVIAHLRVVTSTKNLQEDTEYWLGCSEAFTCDAAWTLNLPRFERELGGGMK